MIVLRLGDSCDILPTLAADSVDAVVTDPPAGIGFMGKAWDSFDGRCNGDAQEDRDAANRGPGAGPGNQPFGYSGSALPKAGERDAFVEFLSGVLRECLRIARPGSVLLCWALPRTSHWTGLAIEAAGWQIEDRIAHHFGTGFPKHKSRLKPATEDWWLARKPGPKWLGVDACRVEGTWKRNGTEHDIRGGRFGAHDNSRCDDRPDSQESNPAGRWPSNLVLSHGDCQGGVCSEDCPIRLLGEQGGESKSGTVGPHHQRHSAKGWSGPFMDDFGGPASRSFREGDSGTAARFFPNFDHDPFIYESKASRDDRNKNCGSNGHPTVKSVHLMRWLCRLACPPGGTILDPFMGSGSTGKAALLEGFRFVGVERDPEYYELAKRRIEDPHPLFAALEDRE